MTIERALEQIETGTQAIPSNPHANTGLSDAVTWDEVREWLTTLHDSGPLEKVRALADAWEARGEADMAYSKTIQDEDIAIEILTNGAQMVESARHIRNAIGAPPVIPESAVEAAAFTPPLVPVNRIGCQECSYNSKYGTIYCKEHRGW